MGATLPIGDFGDATKAGFHFGAHIATSQLFPATSLRVEVQHNRMKHEVSSSNALVTSGSVNAVVSGSGTVAAPYAIFGAGVYYVQTVLRGTTAGTTRYDNVTNAGLNGGAGVRFPLAGFDAFAEARVHWIKTDDTKFFGSSAMYVPLSFGITF